MMKKIWPEQLLALGKTSEVYVWEDGQVLKLFMPGMPIEYAQHEAVMTQAVYEAGLPVPQAGEVVEMDGRFGFTLQHITGFSLLEIWLQNPAETEPIAQLLAKLHQQIHAVSAPPVEAMPRQRDWVANTIADAVGLETAVKKTALATLHNLPDGDILCHGDFHPGNILLAEDGRVVVIDWFTAVVGHPLGDVAQTSFLLTQAQLPDELATLLTPDLRQRLQQQYVASYLQTAHVWQETFASWQAIAKTCGGDLTHPRYFPG